MSCPHTTCKHGGKRDTHHRYWPAHWYKTPLEKAFRNHPSNIERNICRCFHDLEHLKKPPKKPSIEEMRRVVGDKR